MRWLAAGTAAACWLALGAVQAQTSPAAERGWVQAAEASAVLPRDPLTPEWQWRLWDEQDGLGEAWQVERGAGAVVAIIDSGVQFSHPDLQAAAWTNPGEIPGNGLDDDHDGFVDDVHGASMIGEDPAVDPLGHGTHVAGLVAARRNGFGTVGVAPEAQLMSVQVLNREGQGTSFNTARAVRYAVAHGAQIINLSMHGLATPELRSALAEAAVHGVLVAQAAGNAGQDLATLPGMLEGQGGPTTVTVASLDSSGQLSTFSNWGGPADLGSWGELMYSTVPPDGWAANSGTSMATPQLAGQAALLAAARPAVGAAGWRQALLAAVRPRMALQGRLRFPGSANAALALQRLAGLRAPPLRITRLRLRRQGRRVRVTWRLAPWTPPGLEVCWEGRCRQVRHSQLWLRPRRWPLRVTLRARSSSGELLAQRSSRLR